MSILAEILARAVNLFANSLVILVFARVVLSWIYPHVRNTLVFWVWRLTEPFLEPLRRMLPRTAGVDLSPWVALVLIFLGRAIIMRILYAWL